MARWVVLLRHSKKVLNSIEAVLFTTLPNRTVILQYLSHLTHLVIFDPPHLGFSPSSHVSYTRCSYCISRKILPWVLYLSSFYYFTARWYNPTSCKDTQMMPEDTILRLWSSISLQRSSWSRRSPDKAWRNSRLARSTITSHGSSALLGALSEESKRQTLHSSANNTLLCSISVYVSSSSS